MERASLQRVAGPEEPVQDEPRVVEKAGEITGHQGFIEYFQFIIEARNNNLYFYR